MDQSRRTADGYLAVSAKFARPGVQVYAGREVDPDNSHGLRDQMVNVLRPADEVFSTATMDSFRFKPITDDHPTVGVNSKNWKDLGGGLATDIMRDGDWSRMHALMMDGVLADKVEGGKRQLSAGYSAHIEFGDFTAPDGTKCQAKQTQIRGNHIAVVDSARAGPEASIIVDSFAQCAALPSNLFDSLTNREPEMTTKTITFDGLPLLVTDAAEAAIGKRDGEIKVLTDAKVKAEAQNATDAASIVAKDAEIAKLKKQVEDAKVTPQQMRDAAKAYALTCDKAKAMGVTITDAMDETAIMKAVVDKAMPGNTYEGDHIGIAFAALTKDARVETKTFTAPNGQPIVANDSGDAASAYVQMVRDMKGEKTAEGSK